MQDSLRPHFLDDVSSNPFLEDVFVDQADRLPGIPAIHEREFALLHSVATGLLQYRKSPTGSYGRVLLLTAPEAGYGKSHLIARLRQSFVGRVATIPLPFDSSQPVNWATLLPALLRQFTASSEPTTSSASYFEQVSRFFLSRLILIAQGADSAQARECPADHYHLQTEYGTLLSKNPDPKVLYWLEKYASILIKESDTSLSQFFELDSSALEFWARTLLDFNLQSTQSLDRLYHLSNSESKTRLLQLLRISSEYQPSLFVADGLDAFHRSEMAGIEISEIVSSIRGRILNSATILCVNEDLWTSTFTSYLPSALLDRLDGETVQLHSLDADLAKALILHRLEKTPISRDAARCFVQQLAETHHWNEGDYPLPARRALREAKDLWQKEARVFLSQKASSSSSPNPELRVTATAIPPSSPTSVASPTQNTEKTFSKTSFTQSPTHSPAPSPAPAVHASSQSNFQSTPQSSRRQGPPPLPTPPQPAATQAIPTPGPSREKMADLTSIDSIIKDIRGTGKTVVSEMSERPLSSSAEAAASIFYNQPAHPPLDPSPASSPFHAPLSTPPRQKESPVSSLWPGPSSQAQADHFAGFSSPEEVEAKAAKTPLTRTEFAGLLTRTEHELLAGPGLALNLERLGDFIRKMGAIHPALGQEEEHYPSSTSTCLRWNVRGHSVLIGFESPRNVYFWNNLLQQSLASNRIEKIVGFSHPTIPFDLDLFASVGFSPLVVQSRVDVIEMNDQELAMIYATESTLRTFDRTSDEEQATQLAALHLDPLWRRIIQIR